jgi:hypothetical protein
MNKPIRPAAKILLILGLFNVVALLIMGNQQVYLQRAVDRLADGLIVLAKLRDAANTLDADLSPDLVAILEADTQKLSVLASAERSNTPPPGLTELGHRYQNTLDRGYQVAADFIQAVQHDPLHRQNADTQVRDVRDQWIKLRLHLQTTSNNNLLILVGLGLLLLLMTTFYPVARSLGTVDV